jgi:hypothetical protein
METFDVEGGQEEDGLPRHYSTGRLTRTQAELVNGWRARLLEDRPLPGQPRVGGVLRLLGLDDRPRASCSDIIATAIGELLRRKPGELEVAQYADAGWQAQQAAAAGRRDDAQAPVYPPVSFYLPADLAGEYETLRREAFEQSQAMRGTVAAEAAQRFPGDEIQQRSWLMGQLAHRGIPVRAARISGGVLARMAIDRWAGRPVDQAVADGAAFAADVHQQLHRGRRDMTQLRR